jgi:hypothetical protein
MKVLITKILDYPGYQIPEANQYTDVGIQSNEKCWAFHGGNWSNSHLNPEDGSSMFLLNVGIRQQHYMVPKPDNHDLSYSVAQKQGDRGRAQPLFSMRCTSGRATEHWLGLTAGRYVASAASTSQSTDGGGASFESRPRHRLS